MNEIFVRELKMPLTIRAFTVPDSNGDFNIYLNTDLSDSAKLSSIQHEKRHIVRGDFCSDAPAGLIECKIGSD